MLNGPQISRGYLCKQARKKLFLYPLFYSNDLNFNVSSLEKKKGFIFGIEKTIKLPKPTFLPKFIYATNQTNS